MSSFDSVDFQSKVAARMKRVGQQDVKPTRVVNRLLEDESVTVDKIAANAVTAEKIEAGSITTAKLAADSITTDKIAANAVTADEISGNQLDVVAANTGTLNVDEYITLGSDSNVKIDGTNKRIIINDGTNDRILIGYQSGGF